LASFFNDYPKIATGPGAYYATADPNKIFSGLGNTISAFDREEMLKGGAAPKFVTFFLPAPTSSSVVHSHMLPADNDGTGRKRDNTGDHSDDNPENPRNGPEYIVQVQDANLGFPAGRLQVYEFQAKLAQSSFVNPRSNR
jgi:hypothetical protein